MPSPKKPQHVNADRKVQPAHAAIYLVAEMKAAVEAFDRGDRNAFDVADAILVAAEAYRAAAKRRRNAA
jgi:hypothetical protein